VTRVVISTVRLADFLEGGGHFWAYMQYAHALSRLECEVSLLDGSAWPEAPPDAAALREFGDRMSRHGIRHAAIATAAGGGAPDANGARYLGMTEPEVHDLLAGADLLLNFNYRLGRDLVSRARRSALVDIDPGLLQHWIGEGLIAPAAHDVYFTTGETVGTPSDPNGDCGIQWVRIRPPVALEAWPYSYDPHAEAFTTISSWWGERDYVRAGDGYYDNTKRAGFLEFADLPQHSDQPLEIALFLADTDEPERRSLEERGWRVRHSREIAGTPEDYRAYVQRSRGEFSWAKASCMRFANAWVSDRTLCYLASGKPVVVQHTGPSAVLPDGEGMFRFRTLAEAARALEAVNADYERQCRLARRLAEENFDADVIVGGMLERAL
jgi:hypothetical protein